MEIPFVRPRSFDHTSLSHDEHFPDRAGRGIRSRSISARHNSATHPRFLLCSAPLRFRWSGTTAPAHQDGTAKRRDTARHGTTRHDTARHDDTTRHGTARHDTARHVTARHLQTRARMYARNTETLSSKRRATRTSVAL